MSNEPSAIPMTDPDESAWLALSDLEWFGTNVEPEVFDRRVTDLYERLKFLRDVLQLNSLGTALYSLARAFATVVYVCQQHELRNIAGQSIGSEAVAELSGIMTEIIGQFVPVLKSHCPDYFPPAREVTLEDLEGWLNDERVSLAKLQNVFSNPAQLVSSPDIQLAKVRLSRATIEQFEAEIALIKLERAEASN